MKTCPGCGSPVSGVPSASCGECGQPLPKASLLEQQGKVVNDEDQEISVDIDPQFYDLLAPLHDAHRSWRAAFGSTIIDLAENWFGQPSISTSELFAIVSPESGQSLLEQGSWMANASLSASFVIFPYGYQSGSPMNPRIDERIARADSGHASRISRILAAEGVQMVPLADDMTWIGWWPTNHGGYAIQYADFMLAANGEIYLYWYSIPLVSLGSFEDSEDAIIAVTAAIPSALQTITYLSECPVPTVPGWLQVEASRPTVLFGSEDAPDVVPLPVARMTISEGPGSTMFFACTDNRGYMQPFLAGGRIDVGLAIPLQTSDQSLTRAIQTSVTTGVRIASIIEDGFLNHQDGELAFQSVLMAQSVLVPGSQQRWLPTSLAGEFTELLTTPQ